PLEGEAGWGVRAERTKKRAEHPIGIGKRVIGDIAQAAPYPPPGNAGALPSSLSRGEWRAQRFVNPNSRPFDRAQEGEGFFLARFAPLVSVAAMWLARVRSSR